MNNPEVTMHELLSCRGFQAHQKAVEAAGIAVGLALKVPVGRCQVRRLDKLVMDAAVA